MIFNEADARAYIAKIGDSGTVERYERFADLLRTENARQNLVSAKSLNDLWVRHFADSAQLLEDVPRETSTWLDLGTGAGFPGLAIAAARPALRVTCVESRNLRTAFLQRVVNTLGLGNCRIVYSRLEQVEALKFEVISARAFAPLDKLLRLATRFSTPSTLWRLPKGRSAAQELDQLQGWSHMFHVKQSLTDDDAGIVAGTLQGRCRESAS